MTQLKENIFYYAACRISFLRTLDLLLDEFIAESSSPERYGYMDHIPMLRGTAPQVQLELLLRTWHALAHTEPGQLKFEQQVVCFATTCELAQASVDDDRRIMRRVSRGPVATDMADLTWLATRVRLLQMTLPFASQAGVLQIESQVAADDLADVRAAGGLSPSEVQALHDIVSRWRVPADMLKKTAGLLTSTERDIVNGFFQEHPQLFTGS